MMHHILLAALLLVSAIAIAQNSSEDGGNNSNLISRCGATNPSEDVLAATESMVKESAEAAGRQLEVNTYFHVVESEDNEGYVTQAMLDDQLTVLNDDYEPYGVSFKLLSSDLTVNDDWATGLYDDEMKTILRQGTYADLNLYFLTDLADNILGICPFPEESVTTTSTAFLMDGCKILAGSMPGGNVQNYDMGHSATHEVGHWFGLLHTFQGESCTGLGDGVDDTPPQESATRGCPANKDSCPDQAGLDSVHNFMDYSDDDCYEGFTDGQATRIFQMWDTFRAET